VTDLYSEQGRVMSEYQYYEFQAIDKPLTEKECSIVSNISSRAIVSPSQAIFTYSYSDFRGDPEKLLLDHFDAMVYIDLTPISRSPNYEHNINLKNRSLSYASKKQEESQKR